MIYKIDFIQGDPRRDTRLEHHLLRMSEPREDILPVLESIRAAAGEVCLPAVPISGVDQITVPAEVCEWIRSVGSELERLQGSDREGGLRLQQFERLLKQSEHRQKADQEKIAKLETDLNASQESISNLGKLL